MIPKSLCDRWGARSVTEITKADVRGVIDEARSSAIPGRAPRTKGPSGAREREMSGALGGMFDWLLCHRGAIDVDPTATLPGAQPSAERDRVLSDREVRAVWTACDSVNPMFAAVIRTMILTGQRRGEVEGMRWDELSDDHRTWTIPGSRTKNKLTHVLPLSASVVALLPDRVGEFVFTTNGRTHVSGFRQGQRPHRRRREVQGAMAVPRYPADRGHRHGRARHPASHHRGLRQPHLRSQGRRRWHLQQGRIRGAEADRHGKVVGGVSAVVTGTTTTTTVVPLRA